MGKREGSEKERLSDICKTAMRLCEGFFARKWTARYARSRPEPLEGET